jgi:hypothetical protein
MYGSSNPGLSRKMLFSPIPEDDTLPAPAHLFDVSSAGPARFVSGANMVW